MTIAYLNGEWLAPVEARVSVFDRGFMFGDAVYEVMAVYDGKIFLLEAHLGRLKRSLEEIRLDSPFNDTQWTTLLLEAIDRSGETEGYLYMQVTRGVEASRSHVYSGQSEPTVLITMTPAPERALITPLRVVTKPDYRWQRADIKVTSLIANGMIKNEALAEGYDEAILVRDGFVTEATSANVFVVREEVILTPPLSNQLLHGVTRNHVVELSREAGFTVEEKAIPESELLTAEEAWISSTGNELRPVVEINGSPVGDGSPGIICQQLDKLFQASKRRGQRCTD